MFIIETHVNETKETLIQEAFHTEVHAESIKELFTSLQKKYGQCKSKIYRDMKDGSTKVVGWVFSRKEKYEDSEDTYQHQVWVELAKRIKHIAESYEVETLYLEK